MDISTLFFSTLFRIILGLAGGVFVVMGAAGVFAIIRGNSVLGGAKNLDEVARRYWDDSDQAAAALRTRVPTFMAGFVSGLVVVLFAILGPGTEWVLFLAGCAALSMVAVWWWLERELAWPGWFVPSEVRGTRGLLAARREARRRRRHVIDGRDLGGNW
ncbi:hypothetical protein ACIGB8_14505 [Promicromonospora sukumoe]|uniref:hypothetical protein n=1 Tax=Promicromonospora sukumoe TaxID=88382 RepID=UPI0037C87B17